MEAMMHEFRIAAETTRRVTPPRGAMRGAPPANQRGVVLLLALIVLVAMTLAGLGMMRAADTGTVVAGNLAFKQSAIHAGDRGIEAAYQWLLAQAGTGALNMTDPASGYVSARPPTEPNLADPLTWADAPAPIVDVETGNSTTYLIERMCTQQDTPYNGANAGVPNECVVSLDDSASTTGGSMAVGAVIFEGTPQLYYRITTRTVGPHNSTSFTQALVMISE
jgi:Tfp pilus assembly protein PilX